MRPFDVREEEQLMSTPAGNRKAEAEDAAGIEDAVRTRTRSPLLLVGGVAGLMLVALRGIVAVASPTHAGSPSLAAGLVIAFIVSSAALLVDLRGRRSERLRADGATIELARRTLGPDATAARSGESHPYRQGLDARPEGASERSLDDPSRDAARPRWPARVTAAVVAALALALGASLFGAGGAGARHRWTFLDETASPASLGLHVAADRGGPWSVEIDPAATGSRALVNRAGDVDAPPAVLVAHAVRGRDLQASTRCRVDPTRAGASCGIVFRYVDGGTHHVARIEPASDRIILARVTHGTERVLGIAGASAGSAWNELSVDARGDAIRVSCNGRLLIDLHDFAPSPTGTVGLWAPSSGEAFFDELAVDVLPQALQAVEMLPLLHRRTG